MPWASACWARRIGWELAHRLAEAGATGVNVTAALRPETHQSLSAEQLKVVQANLGHALRDVYLHDGGTRHRLRCSAPSWLPNKHETHATASGSGTEEDEDDGFAVAASEM